jgi:hypothetical protein
MKTNNDGNDKVSKTAMVLAWYDKFEWLHKYFGFWNVSEVKLKKMSNDVLHVCVMVANDGLSDAHLDKIILLIDSDGNAIGQVGLTETRRKRKRFWFFGPEMEVAGTELFTESIAGAIHRLDPDMLRIHYIIGKEVDGSNTLHLTCPPERLSFAQVLADEVRAAEEAVQRKLGSLAS